MAITTKEVLIKLIADASNAIKGIEKTTKKFDDMSKKFTDFGKKSAIAFAGLALVVGKTIGVFASYEEQMSKVKALSGATEKEFAALQETARELGKTTAFTAKEAGDGLEFMALAGFTAKQSIEALPGVLNLAAASGAQLGIVSDLVTDSLTAFGLEAKDTAKFVDIMAKTSTTSNTTVLQLGEAFKFAAPIANSFGLSVAETSAALGIMADSGIKASMAGTTLRMSLVRLSDPPAEAKEQLDKYAISVTNARGEMLPFNQIMDQSRKAMENMTEQQRLAFVSNVFGTRSISGMTAVLNKSTEAFASYTAEVEDSNGAASEMAEIMLDNVSGALKILNSGLQEAAISIGDAVAPTIRALVDILQNLVNRFNNLNPAVKKFIGFILLFSTGLAGFLAIFGLIGGAILKGVVLFRQLTAVIKAFNIVQGIMNALLVVNPLVWIVLGVIAAIAAIVLLSKTWNNFKKFIFDSIKKIGRIYFALGKTIFNVLTGNFVKAKESYNELRNELKRPVKAKIEVEAEVKGGGGEFGGAGASGDVPPPIDIEKSQVQASAKQAAGEYTDSFTDAVLSNEDAFVMLGQELGNNIMVGILESMFEPINDMLQVVERFFKDLFIKHLQFSKVFKVVWEGMGAVFKGIWDGLSAIVSTALNFIFSENKRAAMGSAIAWANSAAIGAAQAVASVPIVGPALAAGAYLSTLALLIGPALAIGALSFADGGLVPKGEGITKALSPNELVVPEKFTDLIRSGDLALSGGGGGGGNVINVSLEGASFNGTFDDETAFGIGEQIALGIQNSIVAPFPTGGA